MSAFKDGRYPITLDRERRLLFSLNVLDELQDKAGGYDRLDAFLYPEGKPNFKNLKWLLALLINEGAEENDEPVTEKQLGKMIHTGNMNDVFSSIFKAFALGNNGDTDAETDEREDEDEDKDDAEKNSMSGQAL